MGKRFRHPGGDPRRKTLQPITTPARRDCSPSAALAVDVPRLLQGEETYQSKFVGEYYLTGDRAAWTATATTGSWPR